MNAPAAPHKFITSSSHPLTMFDTNDAKPVYRAFKRTQP